MTLRNHTAIKPPEHVNDKIIILELILKFCANVIISKLRIKLYQLLHHL
jgi:hypothetical protein